MTIRDDQLPAGIDMRGIAQLCGGWVGLANACGLRAQTVIKWRRVPDKHVKTVMRLSELPLRVLRPDMARLNDMRVPRKKPTPRRKQ